MRSPCQAKGPLVTPAGPQIRPRGPMSGKEGTVSGNVTPCRSRGPQIRPRGGAPFQAKRAPCQAKGAQYSGQGSPQISPRDSISGKEGTASGHTKLLVWPKWALDQTTGHFFLANGGPQIRPVHFQAKRAPCQAEAKGSSSQATPRESLA